MIVGTTDIDYEAIKSFIGKPDELVLYAESLIPVWARHIKCLAHNQRFYIAIHLRKMLTIPYKTRMELVNELVKDISIQGIVSSFTSITEILDSCDKKALIGMLQEDLKSEK